MPTSDDRGLVKLARTVVYLLIVGYVVLRVGPRILDTLCGGPFGVPVC